MLPMPRQIKSDGLHASGLLRRFERQVKVIRQLANPNSLARCRFFPSPGKPKVFASSIPHPGTARSSVNGLNRAQRLNDWNAWNGLLPVA